MSNDCKINDKMNVICVDSYALSGFLDCCSDEGESAASYTSCVMLSTYNTLIETYDFFRLYLDVLSKYDVIFFIGAISIKGIIENIAGVDIFFIDSHCSLEVIKEKLSEYSRVRLRNHLKLEPVKLTTCECRVIILLLRGYSPSNISKVLGLNQKVISSRKRTVMKKYGVNSTIELIMKHSLNNKIKYTLAN